MKLLVRLKHYAAGSFRQLALKFASVPAETACTRTSQTLYSVLLACRKLV